MKSIVVSAVVALGLAVTQVAAFPHLMTHLDSPMVKEVRDAGLLDNLEKRASAPQGAGALPLLPPLFDAAAQRVSTSGKYAFVAPKSTDARGPCPGLNAMANHGYIPHNGVATIAQFVTGTYEVFGMGADLATFLAVYGAAVDGNLTGWSIAGGPHVGIGGSHNNYEADSSPARGDLNQYGSNTKLVLSQFKQLFALQPKASTANYNLDVLRGFRKTRLAQSKADNPLFVYNPIGGILVSQAAFTFIYRFMANKSAEYPEGILNQAVLKSFMSITGSGSSMKWVPGNERIPTNWYKRNDLDQYTIPYFNADILYIAETVPEILEVGCNQGTVNSYNVLSASTLSGGAYTAAAVAANPVCYGAAFAQAASQTLLGLSAASTALLTGSLANVSTALGLTCPTISSASYTGLVACPGFSLYGGPSGKVAKGAIQQ